MPDYRIADKQTATVNGRPVIIFSFYTKSGGAYLNRGKFTVPAGATDEWCAALAMAYTNEQADEE